MSNPSRSMWRSVCVSIFWLIPEASAAIREKRSSPFSVNTSRTIIVHLSDILGDQRLDARICLAIHSYSDSLRHQLRNTTAEVIEIAPPAVATDLMPGHAQNPNSMPLAAYIAETVANLKTHPKGPENLVQHVAMLRNAERDGNYGKVFGMLNGAH